MRRRNCGPRRRRPRTRLHRLLFFRFGFSIFITFLVVGALVGRDRFAENKWLTIGVAAFALWAAAGAIAHRLVRPLSRVATVADEIGSGNLASRVELGRHAPAELRDLGAAINSMAERIEQQMADQRALLAAVSHEIRTPLAHMRVIAELARSGDPERLAELDDEISLVDGLVDKILASSRLDFDTLSPRRLDAAIVCIGAIERADLDASVLDIEADDTHFEGDAMLIARAVGNLLENAARHGDGVERVRVKADDDTVSIVVSDRGPGFASEQLAQPFADFRPGASAEGSLGLGLALVSRIAVAHGGRLEAANAKVGAEVSLHLPRHPSQ